MHHVSRRFDAQDSMRRNNQKMRLKRLRLYHLGLVIAFIGLACSFFVLNKRRSL